MAVIVNDPLPSHRKRNAS